MNPGEDAQDEEKNGGKRCRHRHSYFLCCSVLMLKETGEFCTLYIYLFIYLFIYIYIHSFIYFLSFYSIYSVLSFSSKNNS
jgi:hypothetical protein